MSEDAIHNAIAAALESEGPTYSGVRRAAKAVLAIIAARFVETEVLDQETGQLKELAAAKEKWLICRIEALREALDSIVHTTDDIAAERAAEFALKFDETGGS